MSKETDDSEVKLELKLKRRSPTLGNLWDEFFLKMLAPDGTIAKEESQGESLCPKNPANG